MTTSKLVPGSTPPSSVRVLIVEDEEPLRRAYARSLERAGFPVDVAENGLRAAELVARNDYQVIVSDVTMPGMGGVALLRLVRERDMDVPVVLMTGQPDVPTAAQAVHYGACQYLTKPIELAELDQVVRRAAGLGRLAKVKREAMLAMESGRFLASDRAGLEVSFGRAIASMWMAYQPIVHSTKRTLYGYEALLRTSEPTIPNPGAFLDAAETLGKMEELGRAVRSIAPLPFAEAAPDPLLFLNLHSSDLEDKKLAHPFGPLAKMATRVVLEITERASLGSVDNLQAKVKELREMGFRLAIDDLGAGYAGLTSFAMLEPEFVKLDMSLVRDVHKNGTKEKLIRTMTALCKDMGMLVVAEGVETVEERDMLIEIGCDLLQGYLLAKPGRPFPPFHW